MLCESSAESPGVPGLGVLPVRVVPLTGSVVVSVPQLGWNRIAADAPCELLNSGDAYFANSFVIRDVPLGWRGAREITAARLSPRLEQATCWPASSIPSFPERLGNGSSSDGSTL